MFSTLRFRLWLTYVLIVGIVIFIAGLAFTIYILRNPAVDRREQQRLRLVSNLILQRSQIFNLPPGSFKSDRIQNAVERADTASGVRVALFDAVGQLLADSRQGRVPPLPAWDSLLKERKPMNSLIFRDESGQQWLYVLSPMEGGNYMLVAVPRPRLPVLTVLRDELLPPVIRGVALALMMSLVMAFWMANWVTEPLRRLAHAAKSASIGRFQKIKPGGPSEVQSVANAFNEMSDRVQASQRSQRDFIANVSHDLKTPLTSIQGFAQAIIDGTADDPGSSKQAAEVIYSEAERMHHMVLDLLELARLDSGVVEYERKELDLGKILENIVQKFSLQACQARVSFRLVYNYNEAGESPSRFLPKIVGDADRLTQVFTNLVDNALSYSSSGGEVRLTAQSVDGWVEVWVSDTGPGLPPEEIDRIFERFYQTDKSRSSGSRRGFGLGLAIAREIVQAHGGTISAYNRTQLDPSLFEPDQTLMSGLGSVFVVRLPIIQPKDSALVRRKEESIDVNTSTAKNETKDRLSLDSNSYKSGNLPLP